LTRKAAAADPSKPRAWQRMLSGRRLDLLDPDAADIEITDIARGLARVARWNGQTTGVHAFSVAQHCLIVDEIAQVSGAPWAEDWQLAALLHDAPEFVIGDLISPFKAALGIDYKAFELKLQAAIHVRFGLPAVLPAAVVARIKSADRMAAHFEAVRLAGFDEHEAQLYFGPKPRLPHDLLSALQTIVPDPTDVVEKRFLARFVTLAPTGRIREA
jgi:5'-deoxynucleotidase YfbR-like HD superfamily hydrolase